MPKFQWVLRRFFMHIMVGEDISIHDPEGQEFFSWAAAEEEARAIIKELTMDSLQTSGRLDLDRSLRIVDETGRNVFEDKSELALISAHLTRPAPPLSEVVPAVPAALDRIVRKCLEKQPEARYRSARQLAAALEDAAAGSWTLVDAGAFWEGIELGERANEGVEGTLDLPVIDDS